MGIHSWPVPWHERDRNSEVAIVLGERGVRIDEVASQVMQRAVGARDVEAQSALAALCYRQLRLECSLIPHHVDADMSRSEAISKLNVLRARSDVAMVCAVGFTRGQPTRWPDR